MMSTLYAKGSWLAWLSFDMQVACASVICLGHFIAFSIFVEHFRQPSWRSGCELAECDIFPRVWACCVVFDMSECVAELLNCDVGDWLLVLFVHVLSTENSEVLEHLFVRPVGAIVDFCPTPSSRCCQFSSGRCAIFRPLPTRNWMGLAGDSHVARNSPPPAGSSANFAAKRFPALLVFAVN